VQLLVTGENLGYGAAANRGVAEFGDEYGWVIVANPDIEWGKGSIDELLKAASRWPRGGSFGPLIREPNGEVYPSARLLPSLGKGVGHAVVGRVWRDNPWTKAYRQSDSEVRERTAGWLSGSCLLLRREAFDSVDGFDSRYFMYFEDVDLGDRIGQAGWQNVYVPTAEVVHIGGHSTSKSSAKMLEAHHLSAYRYMADRHQGPEWKPLLAAIKAGLKLRLKLETRK
jgi:N-acetylglucosaminyl-diphospho-decaprenol L-rhamnosyltransferase